MAATEVRLLQAAERDEVAELICVSTNYWYQVHGFPRIFADPASARVLPEVYANLEGSAGLVAQVDGRLAGSCFYHRRPTHVSLGILNVHPNYFGRGVARVLLERIVAVAEAEAKPLRLVSSALNLDSFSLYNRAGFVPRGVYQDMTVAVPPAGLSGPCQLAARVRPAAVEDVAGMAAVEMAVSGIRRDSDYEHFIRNREGFWHVSVCDGPNGQLEGFLASGPGMLGPGVARSEPAAVALVRSELDRWRGRARVLLVPADATQLVGQLYAWGGRNCELHFAQVRGPCPPFRGVTMPSFLPESG
jgi:GNAT superfamily N-acetyltransferase